MPQPSLEALEACLVAQDDGTVLPIVAQPRSSRNAVLGIYDGMIKVALKAPPVEGQANAALLKFLATVLAVPKSSLEIVKGAAGRRKRVWVPKLTPTQIAHLVHQI